MAVQVPVIADASNIEQRARKISDPLERLRFLRRSAAELGKDSTQPYSVARRTFQTKWIAPCLLIAAAIPLTSDAPIRNTLISNLPPAPLPKAGERVANIWRVESTPDY